MTVCVRRLLVLLVLTLAGAAFAGGQAPAVRTDEADSLPAFFSGFSDLQYFMGRLVRAEKMPMIVRTAYVAQGGGFRVTKARGWVEWDVAAIPDSAVVDSVALTTRCNRLVYEMALVRWYQMSNRPSATPSPVTLYDDAGEGHMYGLLPSPDLGEYTVRLGPEAAQDLQQSLSQDWFAVGYDGQGVSQAWETEFVGAPDPKLRVYYSFAGPGHDVGCRVIVAPTGSLDSGLTVTPACSVYNYGTEVDNYNVRMRIGGGYDQTAPVSGHQPGTMLYVTFPDWQAQGRGRFNVTCSTELAGDRSPGNDARRGFVDLVVHDVAASQIVTPRETAQAGALTPAAAVRNAGTIREPTQVFFSISDSLQVVFADSLNLPAGLPFGDSTVRFQTWSAVIGSYTARCSVYSAPDQQPGNNVVSLSFVVVEAAPFHDVGCAVITAPVGAIDSGLAVTPACTTYNYGNQTEDYQVRMIIGGVYDQVAAVSAHEPGTARFVTLPDWLPDGRGSYFVSCSTALSGDANPGNDAAYAQAEVTVHDAVLRAIVAPDDTVPLAPIVPRVTLRNQGTQREPCRAFFAILDTGVLYQDSVIFSFGLPFADTTVTFLAFSPAKATYSARCSVYQAGDQLPGNNVLAKTFTVSGQLPGWYQKAGMPLAPSGKAPKDGAFLTYDAGTGCLYAAKGNKVGDFYTYLEEGDSWKTLGLWPMGHEGKLPKAGSAGCADGLGRIFATKGNNTQGFWKYSADGDSWAQKCDVPLGPTNKKVKGGTGIVRASNGGVYLLKGYKNEFWRYDAEGDSWHALANAPIGANMKWDKGSWLAYDFDRDRIYAHKAKYHEFYYYDVEADSWSGSLSAMPIPGSAGSKKSKDGAAGTYYRGSIYALKGGNTLEVWKYEELSGWMEQEDFPVGGGKKVKSGAGLAATGEGIYALKGNKTTEFWKYVPGGGYWAGTSGSRQGIQGTAAAGRRWSFAVSPNPLASDFATVRLSAGVGRGIPAAVRVFDASGRVVRQSAICNLESAVLDLRSLRQGVYLIVLTDGTHAATQKLVVQR